MRLIIIDYGAGNLFSVTNACRKLGYDPVVTGDPGKVKAADKVIFPGVGNAVTASNGLRNNGLWDIIPALKQPVLGICLGMQMMASELAEGDTKGLGIIKEIIPAFNSESSPGLKIPHMGWNRLMNLRGPLFNGIPEGSYFYFVHSYYMPPSGLSTSLTPYGRLFTSSFNRDNFWGCQFHPEKSGKAGLLLLNNFLTL